MGKKERELREYAAELADSVEGIHVFDIDSDENTEAMRHYLYGVVAAADAIATYQGEPVDVSIAAIVASFVGYMDDLDEGEMHEFAVGFMRMLGDAR